MGADWEQDSELFLVAEAVSAGRQRQATSDRQVIVARHAFVQNLGRGHYELGMDVPPKLRIAFTELALAI